LHGVYAGEAIGELLDGIDNAVTELAHDSDFVGHFVVLRRFGFKAVRAGAAGRAAAPPSEATGPVAPSALSPWSAWWANVARRSASSGRAGEEPRSATAASI